MMGMPPDSFARAEASINSGAAGLTATRTGAHLDESSELSRSRGLFTASEVRRAACMCHITPGGSPESWALIDRCSLFRSIVPIPPQSHRSRRYWSPTRSRSCALPHDFYGVPSNIARRVIDADHARPSLQAGMQYDGPGRTGTKNPGFTGAWRNSGMSGDAAGGLYGGP